MTFITIANLGGVRPSVSPRALPENEAQKSNNLLARIGEFRPLQEDTTVLTGLSGPQTNPKTIFRMERTSAGAINLDEAVGWVALAANANVVRNPVDNDTTGRYFGTYESGPPTAVGWVSGTVNLDVRPMGSPAPTVVATAVSQASTAFTAKDRELSLQTIGVQVLRIIRQALTDSWVGPTTPTNCGYIATQVPLTVTANQNHMSKLYRLSGNPASGAQTVTNGYTPNTTIPAGEFVFAVDPLLKPYFYLTAGETVNGTSFGTNWHAVLSFKAYAKSFTLNSATALSNLRAINMPGTSDGTKFFGNDAMLNGSTGLLTKITAFLNSPMTTPKGRAVQNKFDALNELLIYTGYNLVTVRDTAALCGTITRAIGELQVAVEELEAYYLDLFGATEVTPSQTEFARLVALWYSESGVDATVPAGVPSMMETRFYIYTYVTDWGYESAPALPSAILNMKSTDNAVVTMTAPPTGRNVNKLRLYRSNAGSAGAEFQLAKELTITINATAPVVHTDTLKASELQEVCPSTTWLEPPTNLRGLVSMPNGIMAGFFENTVCFCEPYYPYAWPIEYRITCQHPVVGLGVFGSTLVVLTRGGVDYISGSDSASMSQQRDISKQACESLQSIVSVEGGVVYSSPDGLCFAGGQGVQLITDNHFTRDGWQLVQPTTVRGGYHEGTYYFTCGALGVLYVGCLHLPTSKMTTMTLSASSFWQDAITDRLYYGTGTTIKALFADNAAPRQALWRSKKFQLPKPVPLAWLDIQSDFTHITNVATQSSTASPITVYIYRDGVLVQTTTTLTTPIRLVPGLYKDFEIEIETRARWTRLTLAGSTQELQAVV